MDTSVSPEAQLHATRFEKNEDDIGKQETAPRPMTNKRKRTVTRKRHVPAATCIAIPFTIRLVTTVCSHIVRSILEYLVFLKGLVPTSLPELRQRIEVLENAEKPSFRLKKEYRRVNEILRNVDSFISTVSNLTPTQIVFCVGCSILSAREVFVIRFPLAAWLENEKTAIGYIAPNERIIGAVQRKIVRILLGDEELASWVSESRRNSLHMLVEAKHRCDFRALVDFTLKPGFSLQKLLSRRRAPKVFHLDVGKSENSLVLQDTSESLPNVWYQYKHRIRSFP